MYEDNDNSSRIATEEVVSEMLLVYQNITDPLTKADLYHCIQKVDVYLRRVNIRIQMATKKAEEAAHEIHLKKKELKLLKNAKTTTDSMALEVQQKNEAELENLKSRCRRQEEELKSLKESKKYTDIVCLLQQKEKLERKLEEYKYKVDQLEAYRQKTKPSEEKSQVVRKLTSELTRSQSNSEDLRKQIEELKRHNHHMHNTIAEKDRKIQDLEDRLARRHRPNRDINCLDEVDSVMTGDTVGNIEDEEYEMYEEEVVETKKKKKSQRKRRARQRQTIIEATEQYIYAEIEPHVVETPRYEVNRPLSLLSLAIGIFCSLTMLFTL